MRKISVMIADDNAKIVAQMRDAVESYDDMVITGTADDGFQALEMYKLLMPDILFLDIIMPGIDGFCILERLATLQINKKHTFVALSGISSDYFIQRAFRLGIDYYFIKPHDLSAIVKTARWVFLEKAFFSCSVPPLQRTANMLENAEINDLKVTALLHDFAIYPDTEAFFYLREAILLWINNYKIQEKITVELYPRLSEKFRVSVQKVEKIIRDAITNSWMRDHNKVNNIKRPTNFEFICTFAETIRLSD